MSTTRKSNHWLVVLLGAALVLVLGYQAVASRSQNAPPPVTAATVDLEKVFNNLDARGAEDQRLQTLFEQMQAEDKQRSAELQQLQDALEVEVPGTEKYQQAEERLVRKTLEYQAWVEFKQRQLDREKALVLQKLYNDIKQSLGEMAEQQGYDLILLDDSVKELAPGGEQSVNQQISARRVLYANPAIDITEDLIIRMNNAFSSASQ